MTTSASIGQAHRADRVCAAEPDSRRPARRCPTLARRARSGCPPGPRSSTGCWSCCPARDQDELGDSGSVRSVTHEPCQSSASTARGHLAGRPRTASSASATDIPGRSTSATLPSSIGVDQLAASAGGQEPHIAQQDRVRARPDLDSRHPLAAHTRPAQSSAAATPRSASIFSGFTSTTTKPVVGLQQEVGHMTAQHTAVAARHPERLAGDRRAPSGRSRPATAGHAPAGSRSRPGGPSWPTTASPDSSPWSLYDGKLRTGRPATTASASTSANGPLTSSPRSSR